ncbi:hypothetical protein ABT095_01615 [Kitasatospora sp. NPDC002227]|uniref:hypothetical protein n=1 Tax=Kitasatospora sp. NPDC002227 TaxID=3154773 RepID=UPI00331B37DE
MKKHGCLSILAIVVGLLAVLGWYTVEKFDEWDEEDRPVAVSDPRVCAGTRGNNLSLADATMHFHLVLPGTVTGLTFTSNAGGLQGESDLTLRFTTTPDDLKMFLSASRFPTATTAGPTASPGSPAPQGPGTGPCHLHAPWGLARIEDTDKVSAATRTVTVDSVTDPAHPVVWFEGMDL